VENPKTIVRIIAEADSTVRFQIGEYYLDQPHPDHGGVWYARKYHRNPATGARTTRGRSLGTTDEGEAKIKLASLVAAAPQGHRQGPPSAGDVLTLAVLKAYMDGRGADIASEDVASRGCDLFTDWLTQIKRIDAPVEFWTPSQQIECARWLREHFEHSAGYIERLFNVLRSAFIDACSVKMRLDAVGNPVEAALMIGPPAIVMTRERVATELKIPLPSRPRPATITLDQMAAVLDAIESDHLFRFAMSLATWARPQAVLDFDPRTQAHWTDGSINLAPNDWTQTNKRRPRQPLTLCLSGWLSRWTQEDAQRRTADIAAGKCRSPRP
jgi:hypothetical protein